MNVYGIMYLSLWCSSPQDECMFNTLPYYLTDLFIIAYMYSEVNESLNDTTRCCKQWRPMCALLMQYYHKPSDLIHVKMPLLAVFLQSLKTLQSCFHFCSSRKQDTKLGTKQQSYILYSVCHSGVDHRRLDCRSLVLSIY